MSYKDAFSALGLRRRLTKFSINHKREIIRKFLFGSNTSRYPCGKRGESLNEFEMDQLIVFLAATHFDDYVPSTFGGSKSSRNASDRGDRGTDFNDEHRSRNLQGGGGVMGNDPDIESVLDQLDKEVHRSRSKSRGEGRQGSGVDD